MAYDSATAEVQSKLSSMFASAAMDKTGQLETEETMSENAQEMIGEIEEQAAEFAVSKGYD